MQTESSLEKIKLTDEVIKSFKCSRIFKDCKADINSLDFSKDGKWLVIGSDDNSVSLYDVETGKYFLELSISYRKTETYYNKKYGVSLVTYTHSHKSILCASKLDSERIFISRVIFL